MSDKKIEIEFVEASLENTLEEMKNRREYIKKAMKPAEEARDELAKDTATEKVRLQGTKEPKVPNLKPYTEELDVKDRKELGKLIGEAKADGRSWSVRKSLKEGFRYTFYTSKPSQNLDEDVEEVPVEEIPVDITVTDVKEPIIDPTIEEDEAHKAIRLLKDKLNFHPGDKKGTFVLCLTDEEGKEVECVELKDLTDDEITTLNAVFFEPEEAAKEQEETPEEEVPAEEVVDLTIGEEEPIEEASSAEKRAFKNGGDDLKDLEFGKALARVRDPHERAMLLHQHKLEKSGKKMSDRAEVDDTLARKLDQAEVAAQNKFKAMSDAGYASEEKPLEEGVKISLDDLTLFKPWGGAKDVWDLIIAQDKVAELDKALEDMYPEGITATDLNDILWFEKDWLMDAIDLKPFMPNEDTIDAEVIDTEVESPAEEA